MTSLNGEWKATRQIGSGLEYTRLDFDDSAWDTISVPGHWQDHPAFADYPEKMLFRKRFEAAPAEESKRMFLRFEGAFYFARVWLNGAYLGEHTGYFEPFEFDVSAYLRDGENSLAVFVRCLVEKDNNDKKQILGVYSHWDCLPHHLQPGGIWGDVSLVERPRVHITDLSVGDFSIEQDASEAVFRVTAALGGIVADFTDKPSLRWTLSPANFEGESIEGEIALGDLDPDDPEASFDIAVPSPKLWWTWDRGAQNLYNLETILISSGGEELHSVRVRFGIRTLELRDWHMYLNGKRMFCRGSNYAPCDVRPATATRERYERDIRLMLDANLNIIRVHAHVEKQSFYDICDESGILVWQDFPLQWFYSQEIEKEAVRQIQAMVRLLWNHPSVAVWCCHNEPFKSLDAITASELLKPDKLKRLLDPATLFIMNNWNKNVLDVTLKGAVAALDPSRPVIPNSGILPAMGEGTDTHFYFGWYMGTMRGFGGLARLSPKNIRFVTEYGAQSFPSMDVFRKMSDASAVADIDWAALSERHMLQKEIMDKFTPPKTGAVEEYIAATQWYQARVVRYHNELLRRYKYSPCGGAVHFMFNDAMPGVTWSVVDSDRIPKQAYAALRDSFRLLLPVADMPRRWYPRGDLISLRLFVINDYESAFPGATLKWAFFNADGAEMASGTEALDIDPDSAYRCGRARWISADAPRGGYAFVLELSGPGIDKPVLNQYEFEIRK